MKKFAAVTLFTAIAAIALPASAGPIALQGSFASNLSTGTYDATFSGKSFLPEQYLINSLNFSFSFKDDQIDGWTSSNPTIDKMTATGYGYESGLFNVKYVRDVKIEQTVTRTGEKESARLSLGGVEVGAGATAQVDSTATDTSKKRVYDGEDCFFFCDYFYSDVKTITTTLTKDWTGAFTISGTVTNQDILNMLLKDKQLQVGLKIAGDLILTNASLAVDFTKVEPNPVPEPSTMLLALAGLGAIGYARRRRV